MTPPTLLYRHEAFAGHDTGPSHPEHPSRIIAIDHELENRGLLEDRVVPEWDVATDEQILRVHTPRLLDALEQLTAAGGGSIDPDTAVEPDSLLAARLAAGAAVAAVDELAAERTRTAFILGRPPGHHATADRAMGFCLLNTVAIAAAHAIDIGFRRVAIVDWDVHHGNGTQDIFYERDDILFASTHRYDGWFFPGTGAEDERGAGRGEGFTVNVPLAPGDGDEEILRAFDTVILPGVHAFAPDLIVVSAGYDAHRIDPLGGLMVSDDGFRTLTSRVMGLARQHTGGKMIAVLEGGYHPQASARCVATTIELMDGSPQ